MARRRVRDRTIDLGALAATTLLAAVLVVVSGCGGTPGVYTNDTYGFSLHVARPLVEWRTASASGDTAFQVSFVDEGGARAGERYLDSLTVAVVRTGAQVGADQLTQVRAALRSLGARMAGRLGQDLQAQAPSDVSLNGVPGIVLPFAVTISGQRVVGWEYLLAGNGRVYVLTASATAGHWGADEPLFERAITSFKTR